MVKSVFPKNKGLPNFAIDFKFGLQLGFAKAHHKITCSKKVGVALG